MLLLLCKRSCFPFFYVEADGKHKGKNRSSANFSASHLSFKYCILRHTLTHIWCKTKIQAGFIHKAGANNFSFTTFDICEHIWHIHVNAALKYHPLAFETIKQGLKKVNWKQHYRFANTLTVLVDKPVGFIYSRYLAVHAVYIIHHHKMLKKKTLASLQTDTRQC